MAYINNLLVVMSVKIMGQEPQKILHKINENTGKNFRINCFRTQGINQRLIENQRAFIQ